MPNPECSQVPKGNSRAVRVFISSTFRDMRPERELLTKRVFPELRRRFRDRRTQIVDVDLRWGITEEQSKRGETLPLCLTEIERCRPYFIVLLGERYGWVPETIDPALLADHPWLQRFQGHSVTSMEIVHGILNHPERARRALFYFRDPLYVEKLPSHEQGDYVSESKAAAERLRLLKAEIRASPFGQRENYSNPDELASAVLNDLTEIIEQEFPDEFPASDIAENAALHAAFADNASQGFVGFEAELAALHGAFAAGPARIFVEGDEGSGKSALLATWLQQVQIAHPDLRCAAAFVGATPDSVEIRNLGPIVGWPLGSEEGEAQTESGENALETFRAALQRASERGPVLLVVDGIERITDRFAAESLLWLPRPLPANLSVVVSARAGFATHALENAGFSTLRLTPLAMPDRERLIAGYLATFGKGLDEADIAALAGHPAAGRPLFIRTVLEALRLRADFFSLKTRIETLLRAHNLRELFDQVLTGLEEDFASHNPSLVRDTFSLLWATRSGLSEPELRTLLGHAGEPLPQALWSPLHIALEGSLLDCSGYLSLAHEALREAVHVRYFRDYQALNSSFAVLAAQLNPALDPRLHNTNFIVRERAARLRIAEMLFPPGAISDPALRDRALDEGLEQFVQAKAWTEVHERLSDAPGLTQAWPEASGAIVRAWRELEEHSTYRFAQTFRTEIENPPPDEATRRILADLRRAISHGSHSNETPRPWLATGSVDAARHALGNDELESARSLCTSAADAAREGRDLTVLCDALTLLATICGRLGDRPAAIRAIREREQIKSTYES